MTANDDATNVSEALSDGDATAVDSVVEDGPGGSPSEPMPLSQKICLSVTAGFLACSVAVVFNVPAILLSLLSFFFIDYWIPTTIVMAVVAILAGAVVGETKRSKGGLVLAASGGLYLTAWVGYAQYLGLSELLASGTIGREAMLFSGTGIASILAGVCGVTCCFFLHQKEPLAKTLPWLPVACIWYSGVAMLICMLASSIVSGSARSEAERAAMKERPATAQELKAIGDGRWNCTFRPGHASVLCRESKP